MAKRVLVIIPFPFDEEGVENRRRQQAEVRTDPEFEFEYRPVKASPSWFDSYHDYLLGDMAAFEAGLSAEAEGFDAVVLDTVSDSGVQALRSVLEIPVVGAGRTMYLTALMLGDRFSVLTQWDPWVAAYRKLLREYGLSERCASIRSIGVEPDVRGLLAEKGEVPELLLAAGRRCIEDDGADVLLLGSTTMHDAAAYLQERLPVPVINPGPLSYKVVEALLDLGLSHSAAAYQRPHEPKPEMARAMLEAAAAGEGR
ncbi:MAG: hydrogenase expression protein HupH [Actinobacteria bacterium]|nr:hydrogenase expression protein HupH [Actinomycetota bacterium]